MIAQNSSVLYITPHCIIIFSHTKSCINVNVASAYVVDHAERGALV